jgi:hypothetical protein
MREAQEAGRRRDEVAAGASTGSGATGPAPVAPQALPDRPLPREELGLLTLLVTYPELIDTPESRRAGDLLVDPAARVLYRSARELLTHASPGQPGGHIDVPTWLESGPGEVRRAVGGALMDAGISRAENPSAQLRALVARLELGRLEAEISMNKRDLERAQSRGDLEATRAIVMASYRLRQTKEELLSALKRP